MNIYVGNISRESSEDTIRKAFEQYGRVDSVSLIKDKYTNILKGFGFVEMPNKDEAENAIQNLNGKMVDGRALTVNQAKPKTEFSRPKKFSSRY